MSAIQPPVKRQAIERLLVAARDVELLLLHHTTTEVEEELLLHVSDLLADLEEVLQ